MIHLRPLLIGVCVVLIAWATAWVLTSCLISDPVKRGEFGDQFGAVNALFSGLAFAVILAALLAQHEATAKQSKQFEQEMREARTRFEKQVELSALASYGDLTRALWESNRDHLKAATQPEERQKWQEAENARYAEMMVVREAFKKIWNERGILKEC